jgi:hypothetical protein
MLKEVAVGIFSIICSLYPLSVFAIDTTPESFIYDFYQYYLHYDFKSGTPENDDKILKYADARLINAIRNSSSDIYYFTQVGSYSSAWADVKISVKKAHKINDMIFTAPVKFIVQNEEYNVVVVLHLRDNRYVIVKVADIYGY